ncbi:MAG TPA: CbiX/SirB N-terminal domain-containing protein [Sulfurovum sp.]|jgi:sirohydrochlorin ferrochelatase|nr:MAG: hypothetical protein B7Y63_04530 [Sulfurovum sp. 35-42-20]OYY57488.1 MAG: hypothetical protein B7Y52_00890 [Sulfurovum sp. 28-43-6]OYZ24747.1 MAG: hypothetical protein B7Y23_08550 [Sulfurovum sp. 16-42-52]OYZ49275.1 MAG: hypothetical protein B7Y13_05150 [Sulfurovum sp. 24-42-9]OZA44728.1 MAG: hypothetical protein B7X80_07120 [Sulfurovum sp. 17-42-90]OZA59280.1 MAG: hypothetical protein B7X69_08675 [Sulfurovum sp. 39-42-12]HQR74134.1 CbiX/SirB N-terminal domain-containing protein [Sulf
MQHKALIIIAHGSRNEKSNTEVRELVQQVKALLGSDFSLVTSAFLEFAYPSLEASILACIQAGKKEIVILPYFLASGNHVTRDIPEIIEKMQKEHTEVTLELKKHLGSASGMASLLKSMV